jgi:apolipoprotein D and lipocalin family protein
MLKRREMMGYLCTLAACVLLVGAACGRFSQPEARPLQTVPQVDLDRYLGRWYEIAKYPHRFQEGCVASTATYARLSVGRIRVENECREGTLDGKVRRATGVAEIVTGDPSNARLTVQFFWPFRGDYWIIELDADYRFAVVGHPSREYLWILSRHPHLEEGVYQELLRKIEARGYDLSRIQRTLQPGG